MAQTSVISLFVSLFAGLLLDIFAFADSDPLIINFISWFFIAAVSFYAFKKNSLTTWIVVSMFIGIKIGYDFPVFSGHLKVVSQIFLRLIKTVIGPLLFATLVVGIAGHSDLKQVGRLGWKSLLYFEIVTTLALFIGLFAINITKAGEGLNLSAFASHDTLPKVPKQSIDQVLLHIFPENIAKAVYEGQILQIVVFSILFGIGLALLGENRKKTCAGVL